MAARTQDPERKPGPLASWVFEEVKRRRPDFAVPADTQGGPPPGLSAAPPAAPEQDLGTARLDAIQREMDALYGDNRGALDQQHMALGDILEAKNILWDRYRDAKKKEFRNPLQWAVGNIAGGIYSLFGGNMEDVKNLIGSEDPRADQLLDQWYGATLEGAKQRGGISEHTANMLADRAKGLVGLAKMEQQMERETQRQEFAQEQAGMRQEFQASLEEQRRQHQEEQLRLRLENSPVEQGRKRDMTIAQDTVQEGTAPPDVIHAAVKAVMADPGLDAEYRARIQGGPSSGVPGGMPGAAKSVTEGIADWAAVIAQKTAGGVMGKTESGEIIEGQLEPAKAADEWAHVHGFDDIDTMIDTLGPDGMKASMRVFQAIAHASGQRIREQFSQGVFPEEGGLPTQKSAATPEQLAMAGELIDLGFGSIEKYIGDRALEILPNAPARNEAIDAARDLVGLAEQHNLPRFVAETMLRSGRRSKARDLAAGEGIRTHDLTSAVAGLYEQIAKDIVSKIPPIGSPFQSEGELYGRAAGDFGVNPQSRRLHEAVLKVLNQKQKSP